MPTKNTNRLFPSCLSNIAQIIYNWDFFSVEFLATKWLGAKKLVYFPWGKCITLSFVKIGLHLLLLCWFPLIHGSEYQGPLGREDHSFGSWDCILLSPSKNPSTQSRYATFLFGCVDICPHPRAESVIRRPELRNHDENFTHKDPNFCTHENVVLRFQARLVDFEKIRNLLRNVLENFVFPKQFANSNRNMKSKFHA